MRTYTVFARVVLNSSRSRICSSIQPPNRPCPSFQRRLAEPGGSPVVESYIALRHMSSSSSSPGPPQDTQQELATADWDPDMIALRPHISKESFPPLPQIRNREISERVFTHRSVHARPTHVFEDQPQDPSPDNERLEHLGDSVLSLVVTEFLSKYYGHLRVGPATKIRALMIGNATLADISVVYGLQTYLRLHPAQAITLKASTNVQADVFEAYIGGLYLDQGLEVVQNWMFTLFRPYAVEAYRIVRGQHGLPMPPRIPLPNSSESPIPNSVDLRLATSSQTIGHLALFNQHLQQRRQTVEWRWEKLNSEGTASTPIWVATAYLDNRLLGRGQGRTKKTAQHEAAKFALEQLGVRC